MSSPNWSSAIRNLSLGALFLVISGAAANANEKAKAPTVPAAAPAKPAAPTENKTTQAEPKAASAPDARAEAKAKPASSELVTRIRDTLKYGNSQQVRDALNSLSRMPADEQKTLLPELRLTCKSQDGLVLRKMAEFIGNAPFNDLDDELAQFLRNKTHEPLFFATVGAIAKKKPASALPVLLQEIREQDFAKPGNRIPDVLHLITVYKDNSLQSFLVEKLEAADTYADYRSAILRYLGEATPWSPQLKDRVLKLVQDEAESLTVRGSAAYALGKAQVAEAKPVLKEALAKIENLKSLDEKKRYTRFRMQIIASLILLQDDEVRQILYAMARDDDEQVRLRAVHQIGQLKLQDARELLLFKSKFDPSARVQKAAKKALSMLDGEKVLPEDSEKEP
jgi:hypothetical protein